MSTARPAPRRSPPRPRPLPQPHPQASAPPRRIKKPHRHEQSSTCPFTRSQNADIIHFPGFDAALFGPAKASPSTTTHENTHNASPDRDGTPSPDRPSTCGGSTASSANLNNFSVDLSIGGRAALNEHRRHVSKYGIDGPQVDSSPSKTHNTHDTSFSSAGSLARRGQDGKGDHHAHGATRHGRASLGSGPVDEWDRIHDAETSTHVSFASTFIVDGDRSSIIHNHSSGESPNTSDDRDGHGEGDNAAAVMLGRSFLSDDGEEGHSDYFNSSEVRLLHTPERNRPLVDEASRLARQLAVEGEDVDRDGNGMGNGEEGVTSSSGAIRFHHVTRSRGAPDPEEEEDVLDGSSSFYVDESTMGDTSASGMAYLFRQAMNLHTDANDSSLGDSPDRSIHTHSDSSSSSPSHGVPKQRNNIASTSFVSFSPDLPSPSTGSRSKISSGSFATRISSSVVESFVECDGGIEFVADISDILTGLPMSSPQTTPSRHTETRRELGDTGRGGHIYTKPPRDPFSTPRRGSPQKRMNIPNEAILSLEGSEKENTDTHLGALSPIVRKAGAEAGKVQSTGSISSKSRVALQSSSQNITEPANWAGLGCPSHDQDLETTPERGGPGSCFLNDSNLSVSVIEGNNDISILSTQIMSPFRSNLSEANTTPPKFESPRRLSKSTSFDSPGQRRGQRCEPNVTFTPNKMRSRSVDSPGRRTRSDFLPKQVVKSLGARYSQPDRFEDNFSQSSGLDSVSRSLLASFQE